jgi:Predicted O-methyltransferase
MGKIVPDAIEHYLAELNRAGSPVLDEIARGNITRGLPLVDAEVGALLRVLATSINASRILEIGTAIGYSGIWLAGALAPGGMLVTMEFDEDRAREARENFARAGLSDRVSVVVGDAQLKLAKVSGPFDLVFQDGAKKLYSPLLDRLVALLRPGGLLSHGQRAVGRRGRAWLPDVAAAESRRHAGHHRIQPARRRTPESADEHRAASRRRVDLRQTVRLKPDTLNRSG